jgi:hypothetical protein
MKEKTYTIFWLTGETQQIKGYDAASAFNNAGIGQGALRAVDFYLEGIEIKDYVWSKENHTWEKL